jgi:chromosomal replication initiation ATPase DnaA
MEPAQLTLDLAPDPRLGRSDFMVTPANAGALATVDNVAGWPSGRMLVAGPSGSGRTHLAAIWAAERGVPLLRGAGFARPEPAPAYALDDADAVAGDPRAEEALFHLLNRADADKAPLLMVARDVPGTWGITLPDLDSRLRACAVTRMARPDDALLTMALVKLCDERQLALDDHVLRYVVTRMERSLAAAARIVDALDRAALDRQKRVSRSMAAGVLAQMKRTPCP